MKNIPALLFLQIAQNEHDKFAHREVSQSDRKASLNHYTLHFFKYASNLDDILLSDDNQDIKLQKSLKQIRDTFLLLLAIGNNFNKDWDIDFNKNKENDFRVVLQSHLSKEINESNYIEKAFRTVFKKGAKLAKVMESLDHMEPVHVRETFRDVTNNMFQEILEVMAFMQEKKSIDFEKNIHITHAVIKSKKPWTAIEYMNSTKGYLVENKLFPDLNLFEPFSNTSQDITNYLNEKRKSSSYTPLNKGLLFRETNVELISPSKEKNDLLNLQVLQFNQEKELQVTNNSYISSNMKVHLENCSFRILGKLMPLSVLMENPEKNKYEIIKNVEEAFSYILSMGTKMNKRLDAYSNHRYDFQDILKESVGKIDRVLTLLNKTCTDLADWNIMSATLDENEKSPTYQLSKIYDELLPYTLSLMRGLQECFNIDFKTNLEKKFELNPIKLTSKKISNSI